MEMPLMIWSVKPTLSFIARFWKKTFQGFDVISAILEKIIWSTKTKDNLCQRRVVVELWLVKFVVFLVPIQWNPAFFLHLMKCFWKKRLKPSKQTEISLDYLLHPKKSIILNPCTVWINTTKTSLWQKINGLGKQ